MDLRLVEHWARIYTKRISPFFFLSTSCRALAHRMKWYNHLIDRNIISVRQRQKFKWVHEYMFCHYTIRMKQFPVFLSLSLSITLRRILSHRRTATLFSYWISFFLKLFLFHNKCGSIDQLIAHYLQFKRCVILSPKQELVNTCLGIRFESKFGILQFWQIRR